MAVDMRDGDNIITFLASEPVDDFAPQFDEIIQIADDIERIFCLGENSSSVHELLRFLIIANRNYTALARYFRLQCIWWPSIISNIWKARS